MKLLNVNETRVVSGASFKTLAASVGIYTDEDLKAAFGVFVLAPISGVVTGLCMSAVYSEFYSPEVGAAVGLIAAGGMTLNVMSMSV